MKPTRPARKASFATSFAALKTAGELPPARGIAGDQLREIRARFDRDANIFFAFFFPFETIQRKLMGVVSNGMICSERELGLSEAHEGVMVLSENVGAHEELAAVFQAIHQGDAGDHG